MTRRISILSVEVWTTTSLLLVLFCYSSFCESYVSKLRLPVSFIRPNLQIGITVASTTRCYAGKKHSEFSVEGENEEEDIDGQDNNDDAVDFRQRKHGGGDLLVKVENTEDRLSNLGEDFYEERNSTSDSIYNHKRSSPEYSVLRPGTVVRVQVGDLSLARKAWKKRRRTGSPLLVPCSIISVDQQSAVRWNLVFLLEKFGRPSNNKRKAGISMSLKELALAYRTYLKSSLLRQTKALGFESTQDMIQEVFNKNVQEWYGVYLEEKEEERETKQNDDDGISATSNSTINMLYLTAPIFRRKAQQRSANAPMLQFRSPKEGEYDDIVVADPIVGSSAQDITCDETSTLTHTGWVRARTRKEDIDSNNKDFDEEKRQKRRREYTHFPLSACLRVYQKDDIDTGRVQEGKIMPAVVFDFDEIGDGGSPLLTLSLNAVGGARQRMKIQPDRKVKVLKQKPKYQMTDLAVGDGPYRAKVVNILGYKQMAMVDLGVGHQLSSSGGKTVQALGILRFQDSVELVGNDDQVKQSYPSEEFNDKEDQDTEDLIAASIDELNQLDDDEDDEKDADEEESYNDTIADDLLSLREETSFEKGLFEDGEKEEDISDLYEVDENGQLMFKDPETGIATILENVEEEEEEEEEEKEKYFEDDYDEEDNDIAQDISENTSDDEYISDDDMSSLFCENEDGSITYRDPDSGEIMVVGKDDEEYEGMMMMKSLIDDDLNKESVTAKETQPEKITIEELDRDEDRVVLVSNRKAELRSKRLTVGEYIDVYVSNVMKQGNQFRVTTNPLIRGQRAKDIKKVEGVKRKLDRLKKNLGGSLKRIYNLKGTECKGIVTAASKSGDWVYVKPQLKDLPVGVGELGDDSEELSCLSAGDEVRVRISGIDKERGQLSMKVISKL
mmetsp:Transcript_23902/g.27398  ORF Transcript_23902/g.27398 Transcript_23902/m.27398 type:complete len:898 (-) Transcript_23902:166-2859(-)